MHILAVIILTTVSSETPSSLVYRGQTGLETCPCHLTCDLEVTSPTSVPHQSVLRWGYSEITCVARHRWRAQAALCLRALIALGKASPGLCLPSLRPGSLHASGKGALCGMAIPGWGPGPPSPGPLTLTPLKLEPSLHTRRLSWEMGAQSPSRLDSGQSGGQWGVPGPL